MIMKPFPDRKLLAEECQKNILKTSPNLNRQQLSVADQCSLTRTFVYSLKTWTRNSFINLSSFTACGSKVSNLIHWINTIPPKTNFYSNTSTDTCIQDLVHLDIYTPVSTFPSNTLQYSHLSLGISYLWSIILDPDVPSPPRACSCNGIII